jgi:hypothetical protein
VEAVTVVGAVEAVTVAETGAAAGTDPDISFET